MNYIHLLDKVLITLEVGDKTALFILLSRDGHIQRKGDGSTGHDLPLQMGHSTQRHFDALMMTIDENLFNYSGVMRKADIAGVQSSLTIIFHGPNDLDFSFRVIYGSESEGPPRELVEILINAVKITEGWYQQQLADNAPKSEKKSWKFW